MKEIKIKMNGSKLVKLEEEVKRIEIKLQVEKSKSIEKALKTEIKEGL